MDGSFSLQSIELRVLRAQYRALYMHAHVPLHMYVYSCCLKNPGYGPQATMQKYAWSLSLSWAQNVSPTDLDAQVVGGATR